MLFRIKETNELIDLGLKNVNGTNWFPEILIIKYLKKTQMKDNVITQKDYNTIRQYITDYFIDEEEIFGITVEFDISETEIRKRVQEAIAGHGIEQHHRITKETLSGIRDDEIRRFSTKIAEI